MARKILVVDDEKLIVKGIRFSLLQDGMEVDCAYDGEEAVDMAKRKEYDIILLDVMLPKYDGFEVCQAIREFSEMPIIMPMTVTAAMRIAAGLSVIPRAFFSGQRRRNIMTAVVMRQRTIMV